MTYEFDADEEKYVLLCLQCGASFTTTGEKKTPCPDCGEAEINPSERDT